VDPGISYINYNDHWPNDTKKSTGAHAKGVIATDDSHGFWLIHSVPKFAAQESGHKYVYPASGETYGQTALCISYKITEIDNILEQLLYMHPNVYTIHVSTHLKSKSSKISALSARKWSSGPMNVQTITSAGGVNFTSFSKAPGDHLHLYSQIMAPVLNTSLYVETWRQGAGHPLPSECRLKKTVENIDDISVSFVNSRLKGGFGYHKDHSKWAISKTSTVPYVCVGDMNRVESQFKRGGGQTCFQNPKVRVEMLLLPGFVLLVLTFVVTSGQHQGKTNHDDDQRPVDRCHKQIVDCMYKVSPDFLKKVLKEWEGAHKRQSSKNHHPRSSEIAHKSKLFALQHWMTRYLSRCIGETKECNGKEIVRCMAVPLTTLFDNTRLDHKSFWITFGEHTSMVAGSISTCPLFTQCVQSLIQRS
ncbi:unnamed protein product, partial [Oppiella nova]